MNVPATLAEIDADLLAALTAKYIAEPKLALGVVTGSSHWPPYYNGEIGDEDIDDLIEQVADDIVDVEEAPALHVTVPPLKLIQLRAAQAALTYHADDIRQRQRAFWDQYNDRRTPASHEGWQGVRR